MSTLKPVKAKLETYHIQTIIYHLKKINIKAEEHIFSGQ
ncbi:Uncharacterised protein [Elizabethkingia anophelis]|uniref:Uncharacterized protein n=1 Tax=Elizabethkingia anophelis TaxID=1117645 RepID=A0A7Z7LX26_9FLAO|nr:Uncharacterised protein [Elizabethkingia anophelis]